MGMAPEAMDQVPAGILAQVPLGRFSESTEIAKAVTYLASADTAYVNGTELLFDGGIAQS